MDSKHIQKIIMPTKLQPDTLVALYILKKYGEKVYPGVSAVPVEFTMVSPGDAETLENQGIILLDFGQGKFDHHRVDRSSENECVTTLVAKQLGVRQRPELLKLIAYAKRDDLEGIGTRSRDPIDRALGLSSIINNLERYYRGRPKEVIGIVFKILEAYWQEEYNRYYRYPAAYKELLAAGKAEEIAIATDQGKQLKVVLIESDEKGLVGFLRAWSEVGAHAVVQRLSSGHTNIITQQSARLNLRGVIKNLRLLEAQQKNITLAETDYYAKGKLREVPEWYFDTAALSIQNGGVVPEGIPATSLSLDEIVAAIVDGFKFHN